MWGLGIVPGAVEGADSGRNIGCDGRVRCGCGGKIVVRDRFLSRNAGFRSRCSPQLATPSHERYDPGMTSRLKIAISLPKDQVARVHREVRAGRADSVSGYI